MLANFDGTSALLTDVHEQVAAREAWKKKVDTFQKKVVDVIAYYYLTPAQRSHFQDTIETLNNWYEKASQQPITQTDEVELHAFISHEQWEINVARTQTITKLRAFGIESPEEFIEVIFPMISKVDAMLYAIRTSEKDEEKSLSILTQDPAYLKVVEALQQLKKSQDILRQQHQDFPLLELGLEVWKKLDFPTDHRMVARLSPLLTVQPDMSVSIAAEPQPDNLPPLHYEARAAFLDIAETVINHQLVNAEIEAINRIQTSSSQLHAPSTPQAIFIAGLPGSGKESAFRKLEQKFGCPIVNADPDLLKPLIWDQMQATGFLQRYGGENQANHKQLFDRNYDPANPFMVEAMHEFSSLVSKLLFWAAVKKQYTVVDQGTLWNTRRYLEQVNVTKEAGYEVSLVALDKITLAEAMRRFIGYRDRGYPIYNLMNALHFRVTVAALMKNGAKENRQAF